MKKISSLLCLILLLGSITACSETEETSVPEGVGLNIEVDGEPENAGVGVGIEVTEESE